MKPVWFSELGFPSVDGCANQPNVFVDPDSVESFYPVGRVDGWIFWHNAPRSMPRLITSTPRMRWKPTLCRASSYGHGMHGRFHFSLISARYGSDGSNWKTGHWVQGKLGLSSLGQIVADLLKKVGYDTTMYDTSRLTDIVSGFIIEQQANGACLFGAISLGLFLRYGGIGRAAEVHQAGQGF